MGQNEERHFSVGELAQMCGVTVRALQYYDRSGLLHASFTEGGRRTYTREDLFRLQQILFLKSLGFPLEQIGSQLLNESNAGNMAAVFEKQRNILREQMDNLQKRLDTLELAIIEAKESQSVSLEKMMAILALMKESNPYTFVVRYFSKEQLHSLAERFHSSEQAQPFINRTSRAFARLRQLYAEKAEPDSPEAQKLAQEWWSMVQDFAGGDPQLLHTLVSSGNDINNWPHEAGNAREMIQNLLSPALHLYFERHNLQIHDTKEGSI